MIWHKTMVLALLAVLTGCCPIVKPRGEPPAPITLEEQTRRLEAWSRQLPLLRATTVLAGVRFDYRDDKGQAHSQDAEGTLWIQQHFSTTPATEGTQDVMLLGQKFNHPVFEAGRNDKFWWFIIRMDTKKAWVGDSTKPLDPATLGTGAKDSASILRADLVPQLLAISPLPSTTPGYTEPMPSARMAMLVDEFTNNLIITDTGRGYVARQIFIDRFTGHVAEVRLYDPAGILVVRSQLSDYQPVTYAPDAPKPAGAGGGTPQFPRKITVSYPAQQMTIALQLDTVTVPAKAPPAAFRTPDFANEGLRVIPQNP